MNEPSMGPQDNDQLLFGYVVDRACDQFESALKKGEGAKIEDFLIGVVAEQRGVLLRELLIIDVSYRRRRGEKPEAQDYFQRFSAEAEFVRNVFAELEANAASTHSLQESAAAGDFIGSAVGPYKLLSVLGEGGFGTVFLADQAEPIRRRVALKIIKAGMDTRQVLARFEAERQVLAMMDHPNIAKVFDAGSTPSGRSYFVMELVHGEPITDYCDRQKLTLEERLELFIPVCQAVQHAHQKGIIHRDIKPKNVLVSVVDDRPMPKVIDFGIAKATAQPLTQQTIFTEQGQLIGTPEYMSPEQAEMSNIDIDTRSDIYSLGVLLYELLTGALPFDRETLRRAGFEEIRRIIREVEPPKPSTKISMLGKDSQDLAGKRRIDLEGLRRRLRQELDWIVMKTLDKDRTRRYATATSMAEDIQRFLAHEPVQAGPPGSWYRMRKYARRYRMPLGIAAGFAAFLVAITSLAIWGYYREADLRAREGIARRQADQERKHAESEKEKAKSAQVQAENALRKESAALQQAEKNLYGNRIALAHQKWLASEVAEAEQQLDACPSQFRCWEWNYLKRLCHLDLCTLRGHSGEVLSVVFSPDGKRLATASRDNTAKIWDADSGREVRTLRGHSEFVDSVAFSPDGKRLATASADRTAKIWDAATGQELLTLRGHSDFVDSVAFSPDGKRLATASGDFTVKIWDTASGKEVRTFRGQEFIMNAVFSPDGKRLAAARADGTARVWDAASGSEVLALVGEDFDGIKSVAFSPDGRRLATVSWFGAAKICDAASGKQVFTLRGQESINSVAFSPDGKRLATASGDKTAKIWDAANGQELRTLCGHSDPINSVAFSSDGKRLATASDDKTAKIWDAISGQEVLTFGGDSVRVKSATFSPDGKRLATAGGDDMAVIWDAASGQDVLTLRWHSGPVNSVTFSPDGKRLATASDDKTAKIWDAISGRKLRTLRGHSGPVKSVTFSPDGKRLVTASGDMTAKTWDAASGKEVRTLHGHSGPVNSATFSPDGKRLATASDDKTAKIWDAESGKEAFTLRGQESIESVAFSPDGKRLATAGGDKTAEIWDAASGQKLRTLCGHSDPINCVAFSPDGKRLVTASWDKTAKIWDAESGQELLTLRGHSNGLSSAVFSPDGKRLATVADDDTVKIWDAMSVEERHYIFADSKRTIGSVNILFHNLFKLLKPLPSKR